MIQVTTILGKLPKIFPRYEFEKLEKHFKNRHYTKHYTVSTVDHITLYTDR